MKRQTAASGPRYRVLYTLGGRGSRTRYAGSFRTLREATIRKQWVSGELAAMRVPAALVDEAPVAAPTLNEQAERWLATRIQIADSTRTRHLSELKRISTFGRRPVDAIAAADVATFVAELAADGYSRGTIRKTLQTLAMVFDYAAVTPNPAHDKQVQLPRLEQEQINPPTADHVQAVYWLLPSKHRLPLLWLDWSGARVSSIDLTLVSDYDEPRRRVRLRGATTKTRRALWVDLPDAIADAVEATLGPREDRDPDARLFAGSGADALRTAIGKACRAAAVPSWSPHDLRHRRISLLHLRGVPWARIGEFVGQRSLSVTADIYTHVLADEVEVDYAALLRP